MVQPDFGEAPLTAHRGPGFQLPGDVIAMLLNRRALTWMTCGCRNLCHQVMFVEDAASAVTPLDPEMILRRSEIGFWRVTCVISDVRRLARIR